MFACSRGRFAFKSFCLAASLFRLDFTFLPGSLVCKELTVIENNFDIIWIIHWIIAFAFIFLIALELRTHEFINDFLLIFVWLRF